MKKKFMFMLLVFGFQLQAISTVMNRRLITSAPLLYTQDDYSYRNFMLEFEPLVSGAFDPEHTIANLTPNGKMSLSLNQQGQGDINPMWLYLGSKNAFEDYHSVTTFTPTQQTYGLLFHTFRQFEHFFFDMRTSLLQAKTLVDITEVGGNTGGVNSDTNIIIQNAYQAFSQNDFEYGKIGNSNQLIGFDNIQIMIGASLPLSTDQQARTESYFAGFALVEVPTGAGTKAQWLFEPQVGTNHWGIGFGCDGMLVGKHGYSFIFGGNFRHFIANWETRSFDLAQNGAWSRYLQVTPLAALDFGMDVGLPGINLFTRDALIEGRNQITMYGRLQKQIQGCVLELGYNLFYNQAETIRQVTRIPAGFGIYDIGNVGGMTTASTARINQADTVSDFDPIELVTSDLDLKSGAAGQWLSNTVAVRLQRVGDIYACGFGASVDLARTAQAMSSWAIWFDFQLLFDCNR